MLHRHAGCLLAYPVPIKQRLECFPVAQTATLAICRLWNRLVAMPDTRLTKQAFLENCALAVICQHQMGVCTLWVICFVVLFSVSVLVSVWFFCLFVHVAPAGAPA